jgi:hypothetical protein
MTEADLVDSAKCPHCREDVSGEELNALETVMAEETMLVCPECDTILGGAMGDGMFASLAATQLAEELDEIRDVVEALMDAAEADQPDDLDDESLELLDDRMGAAEVNIN